MSLNVGTLLATVDVDAKPFDKGLDHMDAGTARVGKSLDTMGSKMTNVGAKMSAVVTLPVAAMFAGATNAASDLAEAVNVTGLMFDQSRPKIDRFVSNAAEGLGQSERAAREATATFGGLLQNLGLTEAASADWSMTLTTLASDLGSAFNASPEEAVVALGSAIRGETEPIRRFNVQLDDASVRTKAVEMGLAGSTAEVDKAGKAQATLALIMEQTDKVQGDFANTSDGLANQQRILKARLEDSAASLGEKLLPMALKAAEGVGALLDGFESLPDGAQTAILAMLGIAAISGPVLAVVGNVLKLADAMRKAQTTAPKLTSAVGKVGRAAGIAGIAVGGFAVAWAVIEKTVRGIDMGKLSDNLADLSNEGTITGEALKILGDDFEALGHKIEIAGNSPFSLFDSSGAREVKEANQDIDALDKTLTSLLQSGHQERAAELFDLIVRKAEEQGVSVDKVRGEFNDYTSALASASAEQKMTDGTTEELTGAMGDAEEQAQDLADEMDTLTEAYERAIGVNMTAEEAVIELESSFADLTQSVKDNGATLDINTEKGRNNRQAILDVTSAAFESARAYAEQTGDVEGAKNMLIQHTERLVGQLTQLGLTETAAREYVAQLGLTPANIDTAFTNNAEAAEQRARNYKAMLDRIPRSVSTSFEMLPGSRQVPKFHTGGLFRAPTAGGEGLAILRDGERVLTPGQAASHGDGHGGGAMSMPAPIVHVYLGTRELEEIVDVRVEYADRQGDRDLASLANAGSRG